MMSYQLPIVSIQPPFVILGLDPRIQCGCDKASHAINHLDILVSRVKPENDERGRGKHYRTKGRLHRNDEGGIEIVL